MQRLCTVLRGPRLAQWSRASSSSTILSFKGVSFEYAPMKPVLTDASFNIKEGSKVTIMGQNGAGKSTILKLINNTVFPSSGSINIRNKLAISTALQAIPPKDREKTVYDFFLQHAHGAQSGLDARIVKVLQRVNMEGIQLDRQIKTFSGGQQARLLLASALILEPDILLLDEPTNNLDVAGIEMLRELIITNPKTCVVISHDEHFLNSFTDSVLYLDNSSKKVEYYDGNYIDVKREISNRIARENAENSRLQREAVQKKQQAGAFANKGGNMRKVAKKLREEAEVLEGGKVNVRLEDRVLKPFEIPLTVVPKGSSMPLTLITITKLALPHGQVRDLSLRPLQMEREMRVQIKGRNGIGKTTCLENIVNGTDNGGSKLGRDVKIGYYRQDFHNLDYEQTVLDALVTASDEKHDMQHIRHTASSFFLTGDIVRQKIGTLSEGQKGLLSLACIVLQEPGLLIMDEPTNHINFRHLPAIARALGTFKGALLVVSHDADFIKKVKVDRIIELD